MRFIDGMPGIPIFKYNGRFGFIRRRPIIGYAMPGNEKMLPDLHLERFLKVNRVS